MKKTISAAMILLAIVNLFAICLTTMSFAGSMKDVIPVAPSGVAAVNTAKGVSVTWGKVKDTAGYKVYRRVPDGKYKEIATVKGVNSDSFIDTDAKSGKTYIYAVKAYNAYNVGKLSEKSTILYLKQPTITKVRSVYGGIKLEWQKSAGAEGYTVYKKVGSKNKVVAEFNSNKVCNYTDKNVSNGKKYTYIVVAHKGIYKSSFAEKTSPIYICAPELSSVKNGDGYVKLTWKKVRIADKYKIYRKTESSSWRSVGTVGGGTTSYKDTNVKSGVKYIYSVRAFSGKSHSAYNMKGITAKYIGVPKDIFLKNYDNKLYISWDKVSNASSYRVYRKVKGGSSWRKLVETTSTKYGDSTIKNGKQYIYTVRAIGKNGGMSAYLNGTKATALKAPEVELICTSKGIDVYWTKMESGTGYIIYRKIKGDTGWDTIAKIKSASTTSYKDKKVKAGKKYIYTVRQIKGDVYGSFDVSGFSVKYCNPPKITASHSPKGVVLKWDKVSAGSGYKIQRKAQGESSWKTIKTISKASTVKYTDKTPVYGKKNNYRVVVNGARLQSNSVYLYGIDPKKKMVALTYDDGPYTPVTNQILDVLKEYNARATFFVVGSRVKTYEECIERAFAMDCELANHTYNHAMLPSSSASTIKTEISKTNKVVKGITGQAPTLVRAPGGAVDSHVKSNVDYPLVNWSVDTLDWKYRNASSVISKVKNNVSDGAIVLMHDLYASTGDATEEFVPWLVKNGYQIVTVSEMMAVKGIDMKAGELYTRA